MPDNILMNKFLQDLIAAANSTLLEEEMEKKFVNTITEIFGLDKVAIERAKIGDDAKNQLYEYVINTKKSYVDNQLSEYSSFAELIAYKNKGFRSCALLPIVVSGKVVSIVQLLSNSENKFSGELINSTTLGSYVAGLTLLYKYQNDKSIRLASYFNTAFNGPDFQLLVSSDGKIVKANDRARKEFLISRNSTQNVETLLGLNFAQLASLSKSSTNSITLVKNGQSQIYKITTSSISEKLLHILLKDITETEFLRKIPESMSIDSYSGALYLDKDLIVTSATESIKRVIGFDKNLIIGKSLISLTAERQKGEIKELLESKKDKERISGIIELATESGTPSHLRFVLSKWINGYVMVFADAAAEEYIENIRGAFSDFINSTSDMVLRMDAMGYIKEFNLPAERVLGYQNNELLEKDLRSLYADESIFERDIAYVRNGGKIDNSYISLILKDGNKIDATHSIRLFKGPERIDYLIVIKELETKRKLSDLEENFAKDENKIKKLTTTGDQKSQFILNISHELKTPLTNIKGFSKLLYSGAFGPLNKDQLNYISTIIDEADRLMLIIQQVLDAAKLESERMKLELREVDLREIANNSTIKSLQEAATNKGLSFSWNVDFNVPNITADPNRLMQIFVNLIGNAIKFTDKGGIKVKISSKSKSFVQCDVIDTGIGMNDEDQKKLFKKFYEAPKKELVKQDGSGTGLGLSITKEIVALHGGKIDCISEPDKGSTFYFTLRVKPRTKKKS